MLTSQERDDTTTEALDFAGRPAADGRRDVAAALPLEQVGAAEQRTDPAFDFLGRGGGAPILEGTVDVAEPRPGLAAPLDQRQ